MEKITLLTDDDEAVDFYVLEETKIGGVDYILVTDSDEEEAEALILKDTSSDGDPEAVYEIVEDEEELEAVSKIFVQMLDDIDIEM